MRALCSVIVFFLLPKTVPFMTK